MTSLKSDQLYLGIDVGTGSVRAALFDPSGKRAALAVQDIDIWHPEPDFVEQSSENIWEACCRAVQTALREADSGPELVRGIGFDATCSLVVLGPRDEPVTVSPAGDDAHNVIVWMDHRALDQAARINATGHPVLKYVGGTISPEMQSPKLLWLKENLPRTWERAARFFDLADFLTYRASGSDIRSLCCTVCKWTYVESAGGWDDSYWRQVGLGDLLEEEYARIGQTIRPIGETVGKGLTERAAQELGLLPGTSVAVSIIDAHAGGIGMLGAALEEKEPAVEDFNHRLALIGGTSSCHMAVSPDARFVPGVWGPYGSAMIPHMWLNEGGQSATGSLVDHIIYSHTRSRELEENARRSGRTVYDLLNDRLNVLGQDVDFPALLTRGLHVLPYFHGNRSPHADPTLRGMISGLKLSDSVDDLAVLYLATIQAIAHGTRHIISTLNDHGYQIDTVFACGGGTRNPLFLREHADITECPLILPREPEAVLLGSAILGAVASGDFPSILEAMKSMSGVDRTVNPAGENVRRYHRAKHAVFHRMLRDQLDYRRLLSVFS
ncbi:MAG: FGGY-family carbohydrate kinase [Fidelibacterota bacterium]